MKKGTGGRLALLGLAGVLAGCGSSQSGAVGGSPSGSASPSASATAGLLIVIPENTAAGPASNRLDLVRPDGHLQTVLTVRQDGTVLAAAGSRVFVVVRHSGWQLEGMKADGSVESLGSIGTESPLRFVPSPDGGRWLWATSKFDGQKFSSAVTEAGVGRSPTLLAQENTISQVVMPYTWTKVGPTIQEVPSGIGGYILFVPALRAVRRLDPDTGRLTPVSTPSGCNFSDVAGDGTVACVTQRNDRPSITILRRGATPLVVLLSLPRFTLMGDAYFSPDGKLLTVAGAEGRGMQQNGGPERYGVDLITVADGSIRRFGPDGLRPSEQLGAASWLPDGSLILWRPSGAAGGDPGTYVVSPDGRAVKISAYGPPIGLLTS